MKLKKALAVILTATMVMSSALMVCASGGSSGAPSTSSSSTTPSSKSSSSSDSSSSDSSSSSSPSVDAAVVKSADAPVSVAGVSMKTSVAGAYAAKSVQGIAVVTPLAAVKASLGLTGSQVPAITIYDTDLKKSSAAMASINAAADALGAKVIVSLNINLGAKDKGKWVTLSSGSVALTAGLPKNADITKTYSAILVQPGGVITIFEDQDTNPKTVTFEVKAGIGTYAIVAK